MEITALFCNQAATGAHGTLDIHGVLNELYAPGFPARQDRMFLVALIEWERTDHGRYPFLLELLGPDGAAVLSIDGHTDVDARPGHRAPARTELVLPLDNVVFPVPGRYRVRATIGEQKIDGPTLYLLRREQDE